MEAERLAAALEAVLFSIEEGATLEQLQQTFELKADELTAGLRTLEAELKTQGGLQLICVNGVYSLVTKPEVARFVERFLQRPPARLSPAAMITLAIVAYRQPITRPEVDLLRGVNSAYLLDRLEKRGLLKVLGHKDAPGKPRLYGTTALFLQGLGLSSLDELPPLPDLEGEYPEAEADQLAIFDESSN